MFAAELHGKFNRRLDCPGCGKDLAWSTVAPRVSEDLLTSHCFGALAYIAPDLGLGGLARDLGMEEAEDWNVTFWPQERQQIYLLSDDPTAAYEDRTVRCEPDAIIHSRSGAIAMEAKFYMHMGKEDPTQLPEEVLIARRIAKGAEWRLLCVTRDRRKPSIPSFSAPDGKLKHGGPMLPVETAVASYFMAMREILGDAYPEHWPSSDQVESRVAWLSWQQLVATVQSRCTSEAPHVRRMVDDLVQLLKTRGLWPREFHAFRNVPTKPVAWDLAPMLHTKQQESSSSGFGGFSDIPTDSGQWPAFTWLSQSQKGLTQS